MAMLKTLLRACGRGRSYTRTRGVVEATLSVAYARAWPGRVWGLFPGATAVRLVEHDLPILPPGPPGAARRPLRLGFASDLHIGPTTPQRTLDNAFARLAAADLDVLILGGDYVFLAATPARVSELRERVARVPARVKVAVMGNHDLWTFHDRIEQALAEAGVTVLINDALRLPAPYDDVALVGLDDPWTGAPDLPRALAGAAGSPLKLGICHSPEVMPILHGNTDLRLMLCGHTHGGQVARPGYRPFWVLGRCGRKWPHGLHEVDGLHLFVSRGVGGIEVPVRFYAPPDVAVFTLRAASAP